MHQNAVLLYNPNLHSNFTWISGLPHFYRAGAVQTFERWFAVVCRWLIIWEPPPPLLGQTYHIWLVWNYAFERAGFAIRVLYKHAMLSSCNKVCMKFRSPGPAWRYIAYIVVFVACQNSFQKDWVWFSLLSSQIQFQTINQYAANLSSAILPGHKMKNKLTLPGKRMIRTTAEDRKPSTVISVIMQFLP